MTRIKIYYLFTFVLLLPNLKSLAQNQRDTVYLTENSWAFGTVGYKFHGDYSILFSNGFGTGRTFGTIHQKFGEKTEEIETSLIWLINNKELTDSYEMIGYNNDYSPYNYYGLEMQNHPYYGQKIHLDLIRNQSTFFSIPDSIYILEPIESKIRINSNPLNPSITFGLDSTIFIDSNKDSVSIEILNSTIDDLSFTYLFVEFKIFFRKFQEIEKSLYSPNYVLNILPPRFEGGLGADYTITRFIDISNLTSIKVPKSILTNIPAAKIKLGVMRGIRNKYIFEEKEINIYQLSRSYLDIELKQ